MWSSPPFGVARATPRSTPSRPQGCGTTAEVHAASARARRVGRWRREQRRRGSSPRRARSRAVPSGGSRARGRAPVASSAPGALWSLRGLAARSSGRRTIRGRSDCVAAEPRTDRMPTTNEAAAVTQRSSTRNDSDSAVLPVSLGSRRGDEVGHEGGTPTTGRQDH